MTDPEPTKRPARTGAERQRELRTKALELLSGNEDAIASAPVSAILEAIAPAFRKGDPFAVADLANELLRRMDTPHRFKLTWVNPEAVTVTTQPDPEQFRTVTVTRPETQPEAAPRIVTVTRQPAPVEPRIVTVTRLSETPPDTKPARGYSPEVRRMALDMADAGISSTEIVDAIKAAHGKAPAPSNMAKLMRQWRAALDSGSDDD